MEYIVRKLEKTIIDYFNDNQPRGAIITGMVGVGKTTLVQEILKKGSTQFDVFQYSGDDIHFRRQIGEDSRFIIKDVRSQTNKRTLIFVDEIQKTPAILDAVKIAYDEEKICFIVTGSEPAYLVQQVHRHLQRRGKIFHLFPFSLNEIAVHDTLCEQVDPETWAAVLDGESPDILLELKGDWTAVKDRYNPMRDTGFIPLVYQENSKKRKLDALSNIIERGYQYTTGMPQENFDLIQSELARLNNREFTYQTIFNKTRLKRRDKVNNVIRVLTDAGLLSCRRRKLFEDLKTSYHVIYSFNDYGLSYYLHQGTVDKNGYDLENIISCQLQHLRNVSSFAINISYYKPYYVTPSNQIKYQDGEIDFIVETANTIIPIEVKSAVKIQNIHTRHLKTFMEKYNVPYGIIFYQGSPYKDKKQNIYYLPIASL